MIRCILLLVTSLLCLCPILISQTGRTVPAGHVFNPDWAPFLHGVASGDPLSDRVIIWTKVTPEEDLASDHEVRWRVAKDPAFTEIVQSGTAIATSAALHTIKVDVTGLAPGETYYYGFEFEGRHSLTGKTKTTPIGNNVDHLRFGVVSCSNFQAGYFNGYYALAQQRDLDAIIHLGDYIYEYGDLIFANDSIAQERKIEPENEAVLLEDYRLRYSTYRLDTQLIRLHQQHPMIAVWDDHESANDSYTDGAQNHDETTEGSWAQRKAAAKQAYFEWMPIRDSPDQGVFRKVNYGNLMDLIMLDTRLEGREQQLTDITSPDLADSTRTILGQVQKNWFLDELNSSAARWKIIGQQIVFSQLHVGWSALADTSLSYNQAESFFLDIWDGYPSERNQIIDFISENGINNTVFLSGDFHSAFAYDITKEPVAIDLLSVPGFGEVPNHVPSDTYNSLTGAGAIAVEFTTPSITSANFDENAGIDLSMFLQSQINSELVPFPGLSLGNPNPHLKFVDLINHGYYILDVKPDSVQANFYFTPILEVSDSLRWGGSLYTLNGENHLQQAKAPSVNKEILDVPAPPNPPNSTTSLLNNSGALALLNYYPNPVDQVLHVQMAINNKIDISIDIFSAAGKLLQTQSGLQYLPGVHTFPIKMGNLPTGVYSVRLRHREDHQSFQIIKS